MGNKNSKKKEKNNNTYTECNIQKPTFCPSGDHPTSSGLMDPAPINWKNSNFPECNSYVDPRNNFSDNFRANNNITINQYTINNNITINNFNNNYSSNNTKYNNNCRMKTKRTNCSCPICGEEFQNGRFINSGKEKDYFDCRNCGKHFSDKYYFDCLTCKSRFCIQCPSNQRKLLNYSCPLCGENFMNGRFINSGQSKDYFDCRNCGKHFSDKYYFDCLSCGSRFCTNCPKC